MKKIIFLCFVTLFVTASAFAQQQSVNECYDSYRSQLAKGYNALAMAIDNGYFVCGFAFGSFDKQMAFKQSIAQCEAIRVDPSNQIQGIRKIMTHCRIYQFNIVE